MILHWLADRGPWVLVAGIVAGLTMPGLALILVPYIPAMVASLLFLAALRIGPERMRAALGHLPQTLGIVLILQLGLPLTILAICAVLDALATHVALALLIITMAPSIAGSPNAVLMMGFDPSEAMRFLVMGTALLPLTVIPVLYFLPALGSVSDVVAAAVRLLGVIVACGVAAFVLRWTVMRAPGSDTLKAIDGLSALMLATVVIGLMSAVNDAMWGAPLVFGGWIMFVFAVNFGLQIAGYLNSRSYGRDVNAALTVIAGNRNVALFLVALPADVTAPLLVFIGCYQVPMYLTPLITGRVIRRLNSDGGRTSI